MSNRPWETKQEVKSEPVVEPKPVVQAVQPERSSPTVLLSQADAYIHERVKAQPKTRDEIDVRIEKVFDPDHHRLTLPDELGPFLDKYAFRWIFKKEQAISEACDVVGWVLVNRTHFPELPNHLFSVTGSIERGDMLLAFMKLSRAKELRKQPILKSREAIKSRINAHKGNPDFYVPKDESEDGDNPQVIGL